MKLDTGEVIELDIKPNEKILVTWFLSKTITYAFSILFFAYTLFFMFNGMSALTDLEVEENNKTEISSKSTSDVNLSNSEKNNITKSEEKNKNDINFKSPFSIITENWQWALALFVLSMAIIQIYLSYLRKTYRYIITNRRCIFIGGILKRVERTVPYKKITDIQRSQNIIERILGIWNVQIFTPGTASMQVGHAKARAELNFDGLLNSEELYEAINKHTQTN